MNGIFDIPEMYRLYSNNLFDMEEETLKPEDEKGLASQLRLLYPQINQFYGGGNNRENDFIRNRMDNNAGIYSLKDLRNYFLGTPTLTKLGGFFGGPLGLATGIIGTTVADKLGLTQAARDQSAREEAAARGLAKQRNQALQAMRSDRAYSGGQGGGFSEGFDGGASAAAQSDAAAGMGGY